MKKNRKLAKLKSNKLLWNGLIVSFIAVICICAGLYIISSREKEKLKKTEFSAVNKICELATLKCYYHDVAEYEKQADGLFGHGYKKFWIEYDGIMEIGIDIGKVQVNQPDKTGTVKIYVPEAKILNITANPESISKMVEDTGIFTKITAAEQAEAFSEAQATMKNNAEQDSSILMQAYNNAKELLEQYVVKVGEQTGESYVVEWISEPIDNEE